MRDAKPASSISDQASSACFGEWRRPSASSVAASKLCTPSETRVTPASLSAASLSARTDDGASSTVHSEGLPAASVTA